MTGKNVGEWSELYALATLLATSASPSAATLLPRAKRIRHRHAISEQAIEYEISQGAIHVGGEERHKVAVTSSTISGLSLEQFAIIGIKEKLLRFSKTFERIDRNTKARTGSFGTFETE